MVSRRTFRVKIKNLLPSPNILDQFTLIFQLDVPSSGNYSRRHGYVQNSFANKYLFSC